MNERKILIFGGSFDPPHKIHIQILQDAIKKIKPDKTIIIPTYISPFKKSHLLTYKERKNTIILMLKNAKIKATINDFEYNRKKKTYTWMIVKEFKKKYPNSKLYFIIGSDSLKKLKLWKKYKYLISNLIFVVAKRNSYDILKKDISNINFLILKKIYQNLSSTQIRREIFTGNYNNIPIYLAKVIEKRFKIKKTISKIKKLMSKKRFYHTIETIKLSIYLAWIYGIDLKKTFLATALHDVGKDLSLKLQIKLIRKYYPNINKLNEIIKKAPQILHQWSSAAIARKIFKIKDKSILQAISKHTTASKKMSILDKIIYISDISSQDRTFYEAKKIRNLAMTNINKAFELAKKIKIKYVKTASGYVYEQR
ncbi:MAG: nicotinate (nicotinamide) nucleotide adenylyltransferase [Elusimicrobiales bacterium]|nr:nicotinate (nicotinamide) nucleotide adenylyltransferase [Elusimicrobiales bacterium]